jgi:tetratricopeptide (TPR) repeat protein
VGTPSWSEAFTTRDPIAARRVLGEIEERFASALDPLEKAFLLLGKSTAHAIVGQLEDSRHSLAEARRIAPVDNHIFQLHADFGDACIYEAECRFQESVDSFDRMLTKYAQQLQDSQNRYLYEEIQYRRGMALVRLDRFEEALPILRETESFELSNEDRSNLFCHIGICHHRLRNDEMALSYFLRARELGVRKDWQAYFYYHLGYTYYRLRDFAQAKKEFIAAEQEFKASDPSPSLSQVYQMLAYTSKALGQKADAELYSRMAAPS